MTDQACAICLRPSRDRVHDRCRARLRDQLAALPGLADRMTYALIPGSGGAGERVSTGKREAPLPLRLAALTLTAGGSDDARCVFVPKVRRWSDPDRHVTVVFDGQPHRQPVVHRELVRDDRGRPVMVAVDDQAGALPVSTWLEEWTYNWCELFGHTMPTTGRRPRTALAPVPEPVRVGMGWLRTPATRALLAAWLRAVIAACGRDLARTVLGLGEALQPAHRPDDPYADEWATRWDSTALTAAAQAHHRYLTTWLDAACDEHPHIGDFAASLRSLTGAALAALGDTTDLEYVGRCPEPWTDRATGHEAPCGAAIWHDPYVDVITCPRCHAETPLDRRLWLARRILDVWPLDRRRRYPDSLIDVLRLPACGCGTTVRVEWVEVTGRRDQQRYYQIGRVTCPAGCGQPEERIAS